jgi:acetyl-CoA acetyltransferase
MGRPTRAAIVGVGETEFARDIGRSDRTIACEAVKAALKDAGIAAEEVDGVVGMTMETTDETELNRNLGFGDLDFFAQIPGGGGGACALVGLASMAIVTGQAHIVVVYRSRKRASGPRPWTTGTQFHEGSPWMVPYGLVRPVDEVALWARRYLHTYGVTRPQLGSVAVTFREHAHANARAQMSGRPLAMDDYLQSRWISEPLCLYDCSLESDGAVAAIVTSVERAVDLPSPPVVVRAFAQGISRDYQPMLNGWTQDPIRQPSDTAAKTLWSRAEVGPDDVHVAQIYDGFSPMVLKTLDSYGFSGEGEAGQFVAEGALRWPDGKLPTNTSGGGLSEANIHGMNHIAEGVRQIRGTSSRQVDHAEVCFVSSAALAQTSSLILTKS